MDAESEAGLACGPCSPASGGALCQATLDALSSHVAALDGGGAILFVNRSWREFARKNSGPALARSAVGANCFDVCRAAAGGGSADARRALDGMEAVLGGDLPHFEMEYPCDDPQTGEERWFTLRVTPLRDAGVRGIVTSHTNITRLKQLEVLFVREQVSRDRSERQATELGSIEALYRSNGTALTAGSYGMRPLSQSQPEAFAEIVGRYVAVLDLAVEERGYKVDRDIEAKLRDIVQNLAVFKAGPRDVIEVHSAALGPTIVGAPSPKTQAYLEEGRIIVLQAMGYLVSRYRNEALGTAGYQARAKAGGGVYE